jgi:hypothetical protein
VQKLRERQSKAKETQDESLAFATQFSNRLMMIEIERRLKGGLYLFY